MNVRWLEDRIDYDGSQLRAHWILRTTGLVGNTMVAFRGACRVRDDEMADLQDLLSGPGIAGADMVHVLWETFDDGDLLRAVLRQRLLAALAREVLGEQAPRHPLRRSGDDLYDGDRKLSISIATRSQVSSLIHFAVNVVTDGVPVPAVGLAELGVDPRAFGERLLAAAHREMESVAAARAQVRAKGEA